MTTQVVTEKHFEEIHDRKFVVTKEQINVILEAVNKYLLRMINLSLDWRATNNLQSYLLVQLGDFPYYYKMFKDYEKGWI